MLIYKYGLDQFDMIPAGAKIIHVGIQNDVKVWCEVDPDSPSGGYEFVVVGTGQNVPQHLGHAWTWFEGPFVWHLYVSKDLL